MAFLQPLPPCEAEEVVDGDAFGSFSDYRICYHIVYLSWRKPSNEELAYVLGCYIKICSRRL